MGDASAIADEAALRAAANGLSGAGFTWVVLHRDRAKTPARAEALLVRAFGEPALDIEGAAAWQIAPPP
jgi:superoxide dismutase